jgi:DNA-binding MarR family transcriptional regulator
MVKRLQTVDFCKDDDFFISSEINDIRQEMMSRSNKVLAEYGITLRQVLVLAYLELHPQETVTQKTLEDRMHLSNPTVTSLIQTMMNRGWVYRKQEASDNRKYRLFMTQKAKDMLPRCHASSMEMDRSFYQGFTPEELETLKNMLQRIKKNINL